MLCIKHNIVTLRDINRVIENLANQNIQMRSNYLSMQEQDDTEMISHEQHDIEDEDDGQDQEGQQELEEDEEYQNDEEETP